ncbi:MAG: hypothetical protein K0B15_14980 [Lentimicrobium sp.]|nr:hypothetical protein [Lentimicrobium sp.]
MAEFVSSGWIIMFVALFVIYFVPKNSKSLIAIAAVLLNAGVTSWIALPAIFGHAFELTLNAGSFLGNILIRIDDLSAWFILIINFTSVTGVIYGKGYMKAYDNSPFKLTLHWWLFIIFNLSMVWVCILQNGFAFLLAWEIMSLSSMLLVIFDYKNGKTLKAGMKYLGQMHISVVFLTIGFIWVYSDTGSFDFESIRSFFSTNNHVWLFLIFFAGFGLKAGFIPLRGWLPLAHPAAPSHISGVMSGVIVKLGIYGIFRIIGFLQSDYIVPGVLILFLSLITGIYGILNAAIHRDFKRILAYCTIENIGIIGIGIGIGLIGMGNGSPVMYYLGFGGALLHVLNHSLFKSLLFFSAGAVYQQTHTRNMERLGGLIKSMPQTAVLFLIWAIAIGGIPPFNGFVSEFVIYSGLIEGLKSNSLPQIILFVISLAGLSTIVGLSLLTFSKAFGTIFLDTARETLPHKPKEAGYLMLIAQYLIVLVMLSVAFYPQLYLNATREILMGVSNFEYLSLSAFSSHSAKISSINMYSILLIGLTSLLWLLRSQVLKQKSQQIDTTWNCGYLAPNSRMQYTGKSFSKPLVKIFNFLMIERKQFLDLEPGKNFSTKRKYLSACYDFIEIRFSNFFVNRMVYSANCFSFTQNGRIQSYDLYGIIFILAMFILTFFNILV